MTCSEFRDRAFDRSAAADAHAASCPSCAELRRSLDAEARLLSTPAPPAPPDLWNRIQAAIRRPVQAGRPVARWFAAAAAILVAVVGILLFRTSEKPRKPQLDLVVVEAPPEASRAFSGMVPAYDDVQPKDAVMGALTGGRR